MHLDITLRLGTAEAARHQRSVAAQERAAIAMEGIAAALVRVATFLESTHADDGENQAAIDAAAERLRAANDRLAGAVGEASPTTP